MEDSGGRNLASCEKDSLVKVLVLIVGSLVILGLFYSFSYDQDGWNFFPSQDSLQEEDVRLDDVLKRVSMKNKTLIITVINRAYTENASMLELFLESFQLGEGTQNLTQHLLIVALDQAAFDRCEQFHLHCYKLITDGVDFSGEKMFMSEDYLKMVWRRLVFVANVLKHGYSLVFTNLEEIFESLANNPWLYRGLYIIGNGYLNAIKDADILWFRSPFARFSRDDDMQISCDRFDGNPYSTSNAINAGFYFVRSNRKTISLYRLWYKSKDIGIHEQDVLQKLQTMTSFIELGLKFRFLDTLYFSGFCQTSRDMREVNTVHANCCRSLKAKLTDLRAFRKAWENFTATDRKSMGSWPDHKACRNSWRR